jgi:NitT/TauT family transport system substrate-binding protein
MRLPTIRVALSAAMLATLSLPTQAQEKIRVGKAVPEAFSFAPLDVGMQKGIFKKRGLDIESVAFGGDAKMQQASAAGSLEFMLGSGPGMGFIAKGSPVKAVAAMAGPPLLLVIVVRPDGPQTPADLKGKKIAVSTPGSLTYYLVAQTSQRQGWGPTGIDIKPMGAASAHMAALKRGDIDGSIMDIGNAYQLERIGEGRILVRFTDMKDFINHVIFATDKVIAEKPQVVKSFLVGWFETIRFIRANKAETVRIAMEVTGKDESITSRSYDELMPMFSDTGKFDPNALAVISKAFVELKILPNEPDMSQLYTEVYLPR